MKAKNKKLGKKGKVIEELFKYCIKNNNFNFHNDLVKRICKQKGFGNPFDVTKLDNKDKLPDILIKKDYGIVHLGNGNHLFIKGLNNIYHDFEPIQTEIDWKYRKSLLNQFNSSESNMLSVANNQRILHNFLFGEDKEFCEVDILKRPKTYFPHRTKTSFEYSIGNQISLELENIQIEIDLTIEFQGTIGVFEAKNGNSNNFSLFQIFNPYLYYYNASKQKDLIGKIKNIVCVFVVRKKINNIEVINLWSYTFTNFNDITSLKFIKSASYKLIN